MKKNLGKTDRVVRILLGAMLAILNLTGLITGAAGIAFLIAAGVLAATSFISFCPIYFMLGLRSNKIITKTANQ